MGLRGSLVRLPLILFLMFAALDLFAHDDGIPVVTLTPGEHPAKVTLYFSSGGPLERFTSKQDAWYALYRMSLNPAEPCTILLTHGTEPERARVFALDASPFETVSMKHELRMAEIDRGSFRGQSPRTYETVIVLPSNSAISGIYLLVEWTPRSWGDKPPPLLLQALRAGDSYTGKGRPHARWWTWGTTGSFKNQRPVVLPVPRQKDVNTKF